jgi:hypothetical protein
MGVLVRGGLCESMCNTHCNDEVLLFNLGADVTCMLRATSDMAVLLLSGNS